MRPDFRADGAFVVFLRLKGRHDVRLGDMRRIVGREFDAGALSKAGNKTSEKVGIGDGEKK